MGFSPQDAGVLQREAVAEFRDELGFAGEIQLPDAGGAAEEQAGLHSFRPSEHT
jgi:hypothetical protein